MTGDAVPVEKLTVPRRGGRLDRGTWHRGGRGWRRRLERLQRADRNQQNSQAHPKTSRHVHSSLTTLSRVRGEAAPFNAPDKPCQREKCQFEACFLPFLAQVRSSC